MGKYQLCTRDEYGQMSIFDTSDRPQELLKQAKKEVTDLNVNNALTVDDKKRNWDSYVVEILPIKKEENTIELIYAGKGLQQRDEVINIDEKVYDILSDNVKMEDYDIRIYLGELDQKSWYAQDNRGKEINSLQHPDLLGKTFYFIRKI